MKRIAGIVLMAVALLFAAPVYAQFNWGVKGGVNLGNNSLPQLSSEGQVLSLNNYAGFFFGPKAEVRLPVIGLGVEAAALYEQKNLALSTSETFKQNSFQIPLNLKYSFGLGNMVNVFVAAGPEFGFNVGKTPLTIFVEDKSMLSINAGLGVTLLKHLQLGVNYNVPCEEKLYFSYGIVQMSVAYLF